MCLVLKLKGTEQEPRVMVKIIADDYAGADILDMWQEYTKPKGKKTTDQEIAALDNKRTERKPITSSTTSSFSMNEYAVGRLMTKAQMSQK